MSDKKYTINEIFYSIQGEGIRAGTANVFVRFSGCNLKCSADDEFSGFDCDTEFVSGVKYDLDGLIHQIRLKSLSGNPDLAVMEKGNPCLNVILTGGEPSLQIDQPLIDALKSAGYYIAIETNGTNQLPMGLDWVCVSPKSAEHTLRVQTKDDPCPINELKYVRHTGQGIPKPSLTADNYLISPAFSGRGLDRANLLYCIDLVKQNPKWRLSLQLHNFLGVR